MSRDPAAFLSASDRALDALVLGFALWTLCAHAAVFAGLGLDALLAGFAVAAAVCAVVAARLGPAAPAAPANADAGPSTRLDAADGAPSLGLRALVVAGAAGCTAAVAWGAPLTPVWIAAAATVSLAAVREVLAPAAAPRAAEIRRGQVAALALLALLCAVCTLGARRPDADDGFYLALAVAAADDPGAPLLANDPLHGETGVPLPLPVYRVHSLELLQAGLARLSGRPLLDVAHLWLPGIAALLVPLAWGRLARLALPRSWLAATAAAVGVLLFTASASHGWSNFGLVRLHQGKALLLVVLLPLVFAYALELARGGGGRAWLRLAAVQIGAAGASASGLWLAPAAAGVGLLAGAPSLRGAESWRRIALGASASLYVLAVALALRGDTAAAFLDAPIRSPELALTNLELVRQALRVVVGPGLPGLLALFASLGAWTFAPTAAARRLLAFSGLATLVLWNPAWAHTVAAQLTSAPTYWRVLWLLPVPFAIGVLVASPLALAPRGSRRLAAGASLGLAAALFGAGVAQSPRAFALSPQNHVAFGWPSWKIPLSEGDAAWAVVAAAGPGARVLAPQLVAPWIPTFRGHPTPLAVRAEYLPVLHAKLGDDELHRRMRLMQLVSGRHRPPLGEQLLRESIEKDHLAVVCIAKSVHRWPDVVAVLREAGFQEIHANTDYEVWEHPL